MTYQQLWCCVHWPEKGFSVDEAQEKFDSYWRSHDNERELRDHWKKVLAVVMVVLKETER